VHAPSNLFVFVFYLLKERLFKLHPHHGIAMLESN
jgi:hypothetical protein